MSLALVAVERNALASDWTAIQIESNSQTERRIEQEAGKTRCESTICMDRLVVRL
jgi:hypothetical protein